MSTPYLPAVREALATLLPDIQQTKPDTGSVWKVVGPETAGKTALLHALAQELSSQDFVPILVSPPCRQFDSGGLALLRVAGALKSNKLTNGWDGRFFADAAGWDERLDALRDGLEQNSEKVVLLLDEPDRWTPPRGEDSALHSRSAAVVQLLVNVAECRRIVAVGSQTQFPLSATSVTLAARSEPRQFLNDQEWGELATVASEIWNTFGPVLESYSPLQIRLLVAIAALSSVKSLQARLATAQTRAALSRMLAEVLTGKDDHKSLAKMWGQLALERLPFSESLLGRLGAQALPARSRAIVRHCLLYPLGARLAMHQTLRADAFNNHWVEGKPARQAHSVLAAFHRERFAETQQDTTRLADTLQHEAEVFFHLAKAGDLEAALKVRTWFATQLNLLGKTLSFDLRRFDDAVRVFAKAVERDDANDYGHHYLGFNLQVLGRDPDRSETHYRRAIELNPTFVWWRARYVRFLVVLGRVNEARSAWDDAQDACVGADRPEAWVYENLHLPVATLLLRRGQLDFARDVLSSVPEGLMHQPKFRAASRRLTALYEVLEGGGVFPLSIAPEHWWDRGPHLFRERLRGNKRLQRWLPARVEAVEKGILHLRLGERVNGKASYGLAEMTFKEFDASCEDEKASDLREGRFLEIAYFAEGKKAERVIRTHKDEPYDDPDLVEEYPDPTTYIRDWVEKE